MAKRSSADVRTSPAFCHGSLATTHRTVSRSARCFATTAARTCPTCGGSNVPPNTPTRRGTPEPQRLPRAGRLEVAAAILFAFDGFEESLEVAGAEALGPL